MQDPSLPSPTLGVEFLTQAIGLIAACVSLVAALLSHSSKDEKGHRRIKAKLTMALAAISMPFCGSFVDASTNQTAFTAAFGSFILAMLVTSHTMTRRPDFSFLGVLYAGIRNGVIAYVFVFVSVFAATSAS